MAKYEAEVPGNVVQTGINIQNEHLKLARPIYIMSGRQEVGKETGFTMRAIRFRAPSVQGEEWLGIVTAWVDDNAVVAFHRGDTLADCVRGTFNRMVNGKLRWKDDEYGN
jgi:hypothetical protein